MAEQDHSMRITQNVVIRFFKNWIMVWYTFARKLAWPLAYAALLVGAAVALTLYISAPMIGYTVYHYGWGGLISENLEMDGTLILIMTVVWVVITVSIVAAAVKTIEGDTNE